MSTEYKVSSSIPSAIARLQRAVKRFLDQRPAIQILTTNATGNFVTGSTSIVLTQTITWPTWARWATVTVVPDLNVSVTRAATTGLIFAQGTALLTAPGAAQTSGVNTGLTIPNAALSAINMSIPTPGLPAILTSPTATSVTVTWNLPLSGASGDLSSASYAASFKAFVEFQVSDAPTLI